ncbi:hypothetical protein B0H14DRAFT_461606 [Mycena olivaceomarginata]|nr:hypothetical protein B0H14DRAFT_461606 [Mycena olivaceomarginata]
MPHPKPKKSNSSATSSTLASPPPSSTSASLPHPHPHGGAVPRDSGVYADSPLATETEFGAFTSGDAEDDFDGMPGGFSGFGVDELADVEVGAGEREAEVVREALSSPGLSRRAGGFRFGNGSRRGMGTGGFRFIGWGLPVSGSIYSSYSDALSEVCFGVRARFRTHTRCIYRVWVGVFVWRMRLRDFLQPYHTIPRRYITTSIFIVVNHSLALLYSTWHFFFSVYVCRCKSSHFGPVMLVSTKSLGYKY